MGNCMETCAQEKRSELDQDHQNEEGKDQSIVIRDHNNFGKTGSGLRVKIVLTREELEWLLFQLQEGKGGTSVKRLEDVLGEMERSKRAVGDESDDEETKRWKPSLDSIMETPEVPDHMDR